MKKVRILLLFIHYLVGIGALFGGGGALLDTSGRVFGMNASEVLKHSPFNDFFIPGIFLFVVLGLGNIVGAIISHFKRDYMAYISGGLGAILCMWIIIQCFMLREIVLLHILFFVIGGVQGALTLIILYREKSFPFYTKNIESN